MRKMLVLASAIALVGLVGGNAGCGKKGDKKGASAGGDFTCDTVVAKNKKCANEIAEAFLGDMKLKPELKAKLLERMKKSFSSDRFKAKCEKNWNSDRPRDKKMKETLKKCFSKSSCKDFAECFASSMKSGRRGRRHGRHMRGMKPGDMPPPDMK